METVPSGPEAGAGVEPQREQGGTRVRRSLQDLPQGVGAGPIRRAAAVAPDNSATHGVNPISAIPEVNPILLPGNSVTRQFCMERILFNIIIIISNIQVIIFNIIILIIRMFSFELIRLGLPDLYGAVSFDGVGGDKSTTQRSGELASEQKLVLVNALRV